MSRLRGSCILGLSIQTASNSFAIAGVRFFLVITCWFTGVGGQLVGQQVKYVWPEEEVKETVWSETQWRLESQMGTTPAGDQDVAVLDNPSIHLLIRSPGDRTFAKSVKISSGELTLPVGQSLAISAMHVSEGEVLVRGTVDATSVAAEKVHGRLVLGFRRDQMGVPFRRNHEAIQNRGLRRSKMVIGNGGHVTVGRSVVIGQHGGHHGVLRLTGNGGLDAGASISVALRARSCGELVLRSRGTQPITCQIYKHGEGRAVLQYEPNKNGFREIHARTAVQLSGELLLTRYLYDVEVAPETTSAQGTGTYDLITLASSKRAKSIEGFFDRCRIQMDEGQSTTETARYDVDVIDGGRKVVLKRYAQPVTHWEDWARLNLPDGERSRYGDPDGDGLSNLGEFKLGQPATHFNRSYLTVVPQYRGGEDGGVGGDSNSQVVDGWWLRWSERCDRGHDVNVIPQVLKRSFRQTESSMVLDVESRSLAWTSDGFDEFPKEISGHENLVARKFYFRNTTGANESPEFQLFCESSSDTSQRPDILLIVVDDLNDWVSCLGGHPQVKTPHIDQLASRGMLFTQAHAPGVSSHVSRSALLTGLRPGTSGIDREEVPLRTGFEPSRIASQIEHIERPETLLQWMKRAGYVVCGTGRIFDGTPESSDIVESNEEWLDTWSDPDLGKSRFKLWTHDGQTYCEPWSRPPSTLLHRQGMSDQRSLDGLASGLARFDFGDWEDVSLPGQRTSDQRIASWTRDLLLDDRAPGLEGLTTDRPKLYAIGLSGTRNPWYVPAEFREWGDAAVEGSTQPLPELAVPQSVISERTCDWVNMLVAGTAAQSTGKRSATEMAPEFQKAAVGSYLAAIQHTDRQIGFLLDGLDQRVSGRNTWIVLVSDHGIHCGEKGHWGAQTLWARSTHVPMIVVAPGLTRPGSICHQPVSLLDLYPTLVDCLSVPSTHILDGCSLLPILRGDPEAYRGRAETDLDSGQVRRSEPVVSDLNLKQFDDQSVVPISGKQGPLLVKPLEVRARSVVSDQYRYIAYRLHYQELMSDTSSYEFVEELYDLSDPTESRSLISFPSDPDAEVSGLYADVVKEMRCHLPAGFFGSKRSLSTKK